MSQKPYLGRPKPTGAYNSTAKAYYVLAYSNEPFDNLSGWECEVLEGSDHHFVKKIIRYAWDNNMRTVIEGQKSWLKHGIEWENWDDLPSSEGGMKRPIYAIYKYWENDLIQEREYIDQLFPFPLDYGICNFSLLNETAEVAY